MPAGDFIRDASVGDHCRRRRKGSYGPTCTRTILRLALDDLFRGISGRPYNVGSERPVTIRRIAQAASRRHAPPLKVTILGKKMRGAAPARYVPDTSRAASELGLGQEINLHSANGKTMLWNRISNRQTEK